MSLAFALWCPMYLANLIRRALTKITLTSAVVDDGHVKASGVSVVLLNATDVVVCERVWCGAPKGVCACELVSINNGCVHV